MMRDLDDRNEQKSAIIRAVFIILSISIIGLLTYIVSPFSPLIGIEFFQSIEVRCTMFTVGAICVVVLILMIALPF